MSDTPVETPAAEVKSVEEPKTAPAPTEAVVEETPETAAETAVECAAEPAAVTEEAPAAVEAVPVAATEEEKPAEVTPVEETKPVEVAKPVEEVEPTETKPAAAAPIAEAAPIDPAAVVAPAVVTPAAVVPTVAEAPVVAEVSTPPPEEPKEPKITPIQALWAAAQENEHPEIWGVTLADPDTHVPSQIVFQKYLNANDGHLDKAKDQLLKTLQWRAKTKPLELLKQEFDSAKFSSLGYVTSYTVGETYDPAVPESKEVFTWNVYGNVSSMEKTFGNLQE